MHCQCVVEFGQPLVGQDRPDLVPTGAEVLVQITAAGVCHSDLHIRDGGYDMGRGQFLSFKDRGMPLPHVPGHEPVGRVVAAGPDAPALSVDENYVIYPWQGCGTCDDCTRGQENFCPTPRFLGMHADGAYATHMLVPNARYLFPIGDLAPELAAPLACSGLTSYGALKKVEDTLTRVPVVIIGAGGLGLMAVNLVKAMGGLPPVVVDIDAAKRQAALDAGSGAAIDATAADVAEQIVAAVGSQPAAVIDFVGGEKTTSLGFNLLRKGGSLVIVGLFGGAAPWSLPTIPVKSAHIMGSYMGSLNEFKELMAMATSKRLNLLPTVTYGLDQANDALGELEEGRIVGRAVLTP